MCKGKKHTTKIPGLQDKTEVLGQNSQNFLSKFVRFFVTLGLNILRLKWLNVVFEADINK